jgi:hypothetical protein
LEGEEVKADGERIIITEEESEDGLGIITTLRITKAKDEDNGKYTLLVKNTAGEAKADSMIDVMGKPKPPRVVREIEPKQVNILIKIILLGNVYTEIVPIGQALLHTI